MSARSTRYVPRQGRLALPLVLAAAAVASTVPGPASAQDPPEFRASQRGTVTQQLATTTITVDYARPAARGRASLFGGVVHWGEVWTPGANEATTLELSADARVEGHDVPAGIWSVWMIPSEVGAWEMVLDPRDTLFHTQRPELDAEGQIRLEVRTESVEHVEVLTWSFPRLEHDRATLRMAWGDVSVPIEVEVDAAIPETVMAAEEAAPYAGEWMLTFAMAPPGAEMPPPVPLTVWHGEDGGLMARFPPGAFGPPPGGEAASATDEAAMSPRERERAEARRALNEQQGEAFPFALVPFAPGIFRMGYVDDGMLLDVENIFFEFELRDGRPVALEVRGPDDQVFARAERSG